MFDQTMSDKRWLKKQDIALNFNMLLSGQAVSNEQTGRLQPDNDSKFERVEW
jgi:hypothetical protein